MAAWTVVTIGGTVSASAADRRGITSALATVFGDSSQLNVDGLVPVPSGEVVRVLESDELRLDLVRVLAVLALLDGMVEKGKIELVLDFASALHVHAEFVDALHQLHLDHARWVGYDMIRANVFTIPGVPWVPDDPYGPFLPYAGEGADPILSDRYERLGSLDEGTFGRAFYDHYKGTDTRFRETRRAWSRHGPRPTTACTSFRVTRRQPRASSSWRHSPAGRSIRRSISWRATSSPRSSSTTWVSTSTRD